MTKLSRSYIKDQEAARRAATCTSPCPLRPPDDIFAKKDPAWVVSKRGLGEVM
nr:MAG TPA: hypothetical protein [Caudoviricetes sp.]